MYKRHKLVAPIPKANLSKANLIFFSSSASSSLQPCVQPEKANMSISYLRCKATNGPLCCRMLTSLDPKASSCGVNLSPWKFTRHLSHWSASGRPLFARRVSVLLKCTTLCLLKRGNIWKKKFDNQICRSKACVYSSNKAREQHRPALSNSFHQTSSQEAFRTFDTHASC